LKENSKKNKLF